MNECWRQASCEQQEMTVKGKTEDVKNEKIKTQKLENILNKSHEMQSKALTIGWKETMNIVQCSARNEQPSAMG